MAVIINSIFHNALEHALDVESNSTNPTSEMKKIQLLKTIGNIPRSLVTTTGVA